MDHRQERLCQSGEKGIPSSSSCDWLAGLARRKSFSLLRECRLSLKKALLISSPVDRLDLALSDPQFGGNLVKAYAASGLPLPTDIEESVLLRAYNFLASSAESVG